MAETVVFGKTSKKINSISQVFTPIVTTNVLLKGPCSVVAPVFLVKQDFATMRECNYASYAGNFYHVVNVVSVRNKHVEVYCSRDPLATFATDIRNASGYCLFADSAHYDSEVDDARMNPDVIVDSQSGYYNLFSNYFSKNGTIVLRAYSNLDNNTGGVVTYFMSTTDFMQLLSNINSIIATDVTSFGTGVADILKKITVNFLMNGSIKDQIMDCYWVPTPFTFWGEQGYPVTFVCLGAYSTQIGAYTTTTYLEVHKTLEQQLILPASSQAQLHKWLLGPKYYDCQLFHPGGVTNFSCPELVHNRTLYVSMAYAMDTGDYSISIKYGPGHSKLLTTVSGSVRMDLLARAKAEGGNIGQMTGKLISTAVGIMAPEGKTTTDSSTNFVNTTTQNNSVTMATEETHTTSTSGGTGISGQFLSTGSKVSLNSCSMPNNILSLYMDGDNDWANSFYIATTGAYPRIIKDDTYDDYCNEYGWPCNQYITLGDVTGFVQGVGISVAAEGATQREISSINSIVNSGIYIEA